MAPVGEARFQWQDKRLFRLRQWFSRKKQAALGQRSLQKGEAWLGFTCA